MDTYDLTRIVGTLCAALLLFLSVTFLVEGYFERGELDVPAYSVAVLAPESADVAEAVPEVPISELLAGADLARGEKVFKRCAACHQADNAEKHGVGPALWGIVGREIATLAGFKYSDALAEMEGVWDWDTLSAFLANPKKLTPGTRMTFAGLKKPADIAAVMLWLNVRSDAPLSLPGPPSVPE